MRRAGLFLFLLLPVMAVAQEKDPGSMQNGAINSNDAVESGGSSPSAQSNTRKAQSSERTSKPKPEIPGSMVGYIDNPIVDSEIRIRFDDAFEDRFPDRSEFFYAKCACYRMLSGPAQDPNAPGPACRLP
jgi:hypothetical protein